MLRTTVILAGAAVIAACAAASDIQQSVGQTESQSFGQAESAPQTRPPMRQPEPGDPTLPTLWLIGDSTVRNGRGDGSNGQWGWGEPIVAYFDAAKINVVNRAVGGLSSRTFVSQGHWDRVLR